MRKRALIEIRYVEKRRRRAADLAGSNMFERVGMVQPRQLS
jgi:hypothetical protein